MSDPVERDNESTARTIPAPSKPPQPGMGMQWIVGSGLILLAALAFQLGMLVLAMYVLGGVILVSRFLTRSWTESITAHREVNQNEVEIGTRVAVIIEIKNTGRWPITWLVLEDSLPVAALRQKPPRIRVKNRRMEIVGLGAGEVHSLRYQVTFEMRGYYQIGPLLTESGDLFGLHRRFRILTEPQFVLVYPKVIPLLGYSVASKRLLGEIRFTHRLYEDPSRISGVREYMQGDAPNRIHWNATARTGKLHCKTFEPSSIAGATLLLDFHRDGYNDRGEPHRSELAITTVASIANALVQMDQQTGLVTNAHDASERLKFTGWKLEFRTRDDIQSEVAQLPESERLTPQVVETRRNASQLDRILRVLARAELSDGLPLTDLILEAAPRMPRDATVIAVLARVTEESAAALASLSRRGFSVTAILTVFSGEDDYSESIARLLAERIPVRTVESEDDIAHVCSDQVVGRPIL